MPSIPVDISAINTAVVLAAVGLVVHWIRRVNRIFVEWEVMRKGWDLERHTMRETLHDHEVIWEDLTARMRRIEDGNGRWVGQR
jgi:hypothetical protein